MMRALRNLSYLIAAAALVGAIATSATRVMGAQEATKGFVMHPRPKPVAAISFADAQGQAHSLSDFKGKIVVINVWATWCVPCRDEAPLLMQLAENLRVRIVGINYKDQPDNARRFLGRYGNPFVAAGTDESGRAAIEWGVYGVPETFLVGRDGKIAFKLVGGINPDNLERTLKPEIEKALAKS